MQGRIVTTIVAARAESKRAILAQHAGVTEAARAARTLQRMERDRDIPLVLFKDLISSFGIEEHAPDGAAIRYLLQAKSYPRAILEATLTLLRVFPGASISHVEAVRGHLLQKSAKK